MIPLTTLYGIPPLDAGLADGEIDGANETEAFRLLDSGDAERELAGVPSTFVTSPRTLSLLNFPLILLAILINFLLFCKLC